MTADRSGARPRRRLSRSGDFDRVYRDGQSHSNRHLVLYAFPREGAEGEVRLGISVGRRIGNAVTRNRVKRAVREAFWALAGELPEGRDFVIVARPGVEKLQAEAGTPGVQEALAELARAFGGERST